MAERVSETLPVGLHVAVGLEVQPELVAGTEVAGEAEGGVSSDPARAVDDLVDPPGRHTDGDGHTVLRDAQRGDVLLLEDLTGVDGGYKVLTIVLSVAVTTQLRRGALAKVPRVATRCSLPQGVLYGGLPGASKQARLCSAAGSRPVV